MSFLEPYRSDAANHVTGYANETYDLLLGVAATTADPSARAAFLHDAEAMLLEDCAVSPLCFLKEAYLLRPEYKGLSRDCFGHSYLTEIVSTAVNGS